MSAIARLAAALPVVLSLLAVASPAPGQGKARARSRSPIVIAHRGASGYLPEHTLAAYSVAILQGADFVEPDLVMTRDGHLIARHDNALDPTTDVASRPEFARRKATKVVDGQSITGWFSEDFTLAELKTLRAIERVPGIRPGNTRFDRQFEIPTLQEIIDLVEAHEKATGRAIGIYPETKHPTYFAGIGLAMEAPLVRILHRNGYQGQRGKVFIQSFEIDHLQKLRRMTRIPLVQLLGDKGKPYDVEAAGGALTYEQMATAQGLRDIARYADGVGAEKARLIPLDAGGSLDAARATRFVADAHAAGLLVHVYTFRAENFYLPRNHKSAGNASARGELDAELAAFLALGIDGFFTDQADLGARARDALTR
ncbi:MAG TPA: glycerophosphodiester phosphodiesterase [Haliangium sp.]|nr:glycerophosphodiester phosphodiesterase [Haliangium sp.]